MLEVRLEVHACVAAAYCGGVRLARAGRAAQLSTRAFLKSFHLAHHSNLLPYNRQLLLLSVQTIILAILNFALNGYERPSWSVSHACQELLLRLDALPLPCCTFHWHTYYSCGTYLSVASSVLGCSGGARGSRAIRATRPEGRTGRRPGTGAGAAAAARAGGVRYWALRRGRRGNVVFPVLFISHRDGT